MANLTKLARCEYEKNALNAKVVENPGGVRRKLVDVSLGVGATPPVSIHDTLHNVQGHVRLVVLISILATSCAALSSAALDR